MHVEFSFTANELRQALVDFIEKQNGIKVDPDKIDVMHEGEKIYHVIVNADMETL